MVGRLRRGTARAAGGMGGGDARGGRGRGGIVRRSVRSRHLRTCGAGVLEECLDKNENNCTQKIARKTEVQLKTLKYTINEVAP